MAGFGYHKDGRRFIIDGNTFVAPKGELGKFGIGLNFDSIAKHWWTGDEERAKLAVAKLEGWAAEKAEKLATQATYTKVGDEWCARVPRPLIDSARVVVGQVVKIAKSDGSFKNATLGEVVAESADQLICKIQKAEPKGPGKRSGHKAPGGARSCRGCRGPLVHSSHHRAMNGYCGNCAFDEFDC